MGDTRRDIMQNQDQEIDKILENFEFNAITDGLGFHHSVSDKKEIKKSLAERANDLDQDLKRHLDHLKQESKNSTPNRGDLTPFYAADAEEEEVEEIQDLMQPEEPIVLEANPFSRMLAWALDLLIISLMATVTIVAGFAAADLPLELLLESQVLISTLFILYYFLYFTVLDATNHSTFGKRLMKIRIVHNEVAPSLNRSALRTIFCMASFFLLGLPVLLRTQDQFLATKVINR